MPREFYFDTEGFYTLLSAFSCTNSETNSQVTSVKTSNRPRSWRMLVSWWQQIMLSPTVKILRVVITKGAKCCLNCLIIRQTNICPIVLSTPIISMWTKKSLCSKIKSNMSMISKRRQEQTKEIMETHLLIQVIIYIGWGLYSDLIQAWKSGRKPSAKRDTMRRTIPINSVCFSLFLEDQGSNTLNIMIPTVIISPITIFLVANLSFLSLTLEQSTPTNITEIRLHDLNIITTGQLVRQMAYVYVNVEMATVIAHTIDFLAGI